MKMSKEEARKIAKEGIEIRTKSGLPGRKKENHNTVEFKCKKPH